MTIERKLTKTSGATSEAVYVEDVFSTWLYTGNGSTQTITNGIDLATKGGLVWIKNRSAGVNASNTLFDTERGINKVLSTDRTGAQNEFGSPSDLLTSFTSTGFSIGADATYGWINNSGFNAASWTFRKQPKFFDIVTYTGTGSARTISHALGSTPGMIIVKRTDTTGNWRVYHRSLTSAANSIQLNLSSAEASATTVWNSTAPTSSVFSVGTDDTVNASGGTYVAYLFAHDAGGFGAAGTDSVVACGSYTADSSGNATVNLGWEPQWLLYRPPAFGAGWDMEDVMRGASVNTFGAPKLQANSSSAEGGASRGMRPTPTGFTVAGGAGIANTTYIYLAIRRGPMKTPTDATKVFLPVASNTASAYTVGFPIDMQISGNRPGFSSNFTVLDRLRGVSTTATELQNGLITSSTGAEGSSTIGSVNWTSVSFTPSGNIGGGQNAYFNFRRAPGFFDVVCYTGNNTEPRQISHGLGVPPHLIIVKARNDGTTDYAWNCYAEPLGASKRIQLHLSDAASNQSMWYGVASTSTYFTTDNNLANSNGKTYVAYLFASCPGVSKVGSYTGNGSSQTIDCGFTNGARFVLIKRADSTGSWWVYDSARGIVSASDPALQLNSTAAEVTSADAVDPASSGFIVNQEATCNINVSSATYIYLSVA